MIDKMIVLGIFVIFCILFYKIYIFYGAVTLIYFELFCLFYFWFIGYVNKIDKD